MTCSDCDGDGRCRWCGGTGEIDGKPCADCDDGICERCSGSGQVDEQQEPQPWWQRQRTPSK